MSAIDRELLVMRGFAASRGDDDAIGEAQRDVEAMRAKIAALTAERDQLRAALECLEQAYRNKHSPQHRAARLNAAGSVLEATK